MKKIAVACAVALSVHARAADIGTQLVQACQSLKRQEDRNKCLEEAVKTMVQNSQPAAAPERSARDAALARAQKAIDAAQAIASVTNSGISLRQYEPYVQQLSIALDQYRQTAQFPQERDAIALLQDALQAYVDAGTYWQADINFFSHGNYRSTYPGAQPTGLTGTRYILDRYDVPITKADIWGLEKGAPLELATTIIWQYAQDKTGAAKDALSGIGALKQAEPTATIEKNEIYPPKIWNGPDGKPVYRAALTPSATKPSVDQPEKENDHPYTMIVDSTYVGGTFAAPDTASARVSVPVAGTKVSVYAYKNGWARVTPKGATAQWIPLNRLSAPD